MALPRPLTDRMEMLLAVVRLGDADRLGWWRSHSVDETAEYVLGESFPSTWMATGLELAMESARIRHNSALERRNAVHLFSDYLPFRHMLRSWLIERKLERDVVPLHWTRDATVEDFKRRLGASVAAGDRRAEGMYLGEVTLTELENETRQQELLSSLGGAYAALDREFLAPYVDLVS
jgi:hypothetical protein